MKREQLNIEQLLEQIGSQEVPGDHAHRYDLRRALLCSRYFSGSNNRTSRWEVFFSYTAPLIAGGVVVGVFTFMAVSINSGDVLDVQTTPQEAAVVIFEGVVDTEEEAVLADTSPSELSFISNGSEPLIQLADFETVVPRENLVRFIPVYPEIPASVR